MRMVLRSGEQCPGSGQAGELMATTLGEPEAGPRREVAGRRRHQDLTWCRPRRRQPPR